MHLNHLNYEWKDIEGFIDDTLVFTNVTFWQ